MDAAIVALYGERVGQLSRLSEDYDFRFEFDPGYVAQPGRATLGQFLMIAYLTRSQPPD